MALTAGFLLVFRSQLAYQRWWEGRTQLALMQAKWSDCAAQAVLFDDMDGEVPIESEVYRFRIIHLFSLLHAVSIQSLRGENSDLGLVEADDELAAPVVENREYRSRAQSVATTTQKIFLQTDRERDAATVELEVLMGITDDERHFLWEIQANPVDGRQPGKEPVDQVFRIVAWIMREVGRRQREGGLKVPPPVLSRLYQVLSDGHNGFMQAKKVAFTPFPLPYAQLVLLFLFVLMISGPVVIVAYVNSTFLAGCLSFLATTASFALNEVGRELEHPFGHEPNDLPLSELHYDFNVRLVSLLHMGLRQNTVNHINVEYLQEGSTHRQRFKSSFAGSVTEKSEIKRGSLPSNDQLPVLQGRSLSQLSSDSGDVGIPLHDFTEADDIMLSPRTAAAAAIEVKLPESN